MLVQFRPRYHHPNIPFRPERLDGRGPLDKREIFAARHPFQPHRLLRVTSLDAADKWDFINSEIHVLELEVGRREIEFGFEKDGTGRADFAFERKTRAAELGAGGDIAETRLHILI